jgi:hypothetical protein
MCLKWQERLREIDMGEGEWAMYERTLQRVTSQVGVSFSKLLNDLYMSI